MNKIVIFKRVNGKIKRRFTVGYTNEAKMRYKVMTYLSQIKHKYGVPENTEYEVVIYRLPPIHDYNLKKVINRLLEIED